MNRLRVRRIKANDATRQIPVIALTAHAMAGDREKAIELSRLLGKVAALLVPKAA
jgi:two-component system cell cycle response regulator DivK